MSRDCNYQYNIHDYCEISSFPIRSLLNQRRVLVILMAVNSSQAITAPMQESPSAGEGLNRNVVSDAFAIQISFSVLT